MYLNWTRFGRLKMCTDFILGYLQTSLFILKESERVSNNA